MGHRSGSVAFSTTKHGHSRDKSPRDYCFWHSTWHFVFPLTMIHFNSAQFLADAEAVSCGFTQPFMPLRQLLASVG